MPDPLDDLLDQAEHETLAEINQNKQAADPMADLLANEERIAQQESENEFYDEIEAQQAAQRMGFDDDYTGTRIAKGALLRGGAGLLGSVRFLLGKTDEPGGSDEAIAAVSDMQKAQASGRKTMGFDTYSPRTEENITGGAASLVQMAPTIPLGGAGMIAGGVVQQGAQSTAKAHQSGLTGPEKYAYIGGNMAIEGTITAAFNRLGIGGIESKNLAKEMLNQSLSRAALRAGLSTVEEIPEEVLIQAGNQAMDVIAGVDPNALDPSTLARVLEDTALQTIVAAGPISAVQSGLNAAHAEDLTEAVPYDVNLADAFARDAMSPDNAQMRQESAPIVQEDAQNVQENTPIGEELAQPVQGVVDPVTGETVTDPDLVEALIEEAAARDDFGGVDEQAYTNMVEGPAEEVDPDDDAAPADTESPRISTPETQAKEEENREEVLPAASPSDRFEEASAGAQVQPSGSRGDEGAQAAQTETTVEPKPAPQEELTQAIRSLVDEIRTERAERAAPKATPKPLEQQADIKEPNNSSPEIPESDVKNSPAGITAETLPLADINVDADALQFRHDADENGVAKKPKGPLDWNTLKPLLVWTDKAGELGEKGKTYVADGHHRHSMLTEAAAKGDARARDSVPVQYLEADTAREARNKAALANLAKGNAKPAEAKEVLADEMERVGANDSPIADMGKAERISGAGGVRLDNRESMELRRDSVRSSEAEKAETKPSKTETIPAENETAHDRVGNYSNRISPAPLSGGTSKKLGEIIIDISKSIGKRVFVTKPSRGAGGTYYPGQSKVAIRYAGDLDTTAHELAHALDDHLGIVADWAYTQGASPFDHELRYFWESPASSATTSGPRSSLTYKRGEGVAEFTRAWLVNPEAAQEAAPMFYRHFMAKLPAATKTALESFSNDIRKFAGMSAMDRTGANIRDIGQEKPTLIQKLKEPFGKAGYPFRTTALDKVKSVLVDDLWPVVNGYRTAKEIRHIVSQSPTRDMEVLLRTLGGITDKVQNFLDNGPERYDWTDANQRRAEGIGGGIDWLVGWADTSSKESLEKDLKALSRYMVNERILEKGKQIDRQVNTLIGKLVDRADAIREKEQDQLDAQAARMRERAKQRAKRQDSAQEAVNDARELAAEEATKADKDLASIADRARKREERRLAKRITKLEARMTSNNRADIESQISRLRERSQRRADRVEKKILASELKQSEARDFGIDDTENEIGKLQKALDQRHYNRLARIGRRAVRMQGSASARKSRLAGTGGGIFADNVQAAEAIAEVMANPVLKARLDEGAKRYRAWARAVLRYQVDSGRLSEEAFQLIESQNEHYVAMHRAQDEDLNVAYAKGTGRRIGSSATTIKKFKGGTRTIDNPYVNLLDQTFRMVKEADRNAVMASFVDLLDTSRNMYQGDPNDLAAIGARAAQGDAGAVKVFIKGEEQHWKFEEGIAAALKAWGEVDDPNFVAKALRLPGQLLRAGVTLSPRFIARNAPRDALNRAVVSRTGGKPTDVLKGFTKSELELLKTGGGSQAGHYMTDKVAYDQQLQDHIDTLSKEPGNIIAPLGKLWKFYKSIGQGSETVGRMAEFKTAFEKGKAKGYNDREATVYAANEARGLIDYAIAGTALRKINRYIPFTNPAVQGLARSVKGFRENPVGFTARWATYVLVPELLTYAWHALMGPDDEEWYRQLPAYQRDFFWNIKIADNLVLSIPKPFEFGVAASGISRLIDKIRGEDHAFQGYLGSVAKATLPMDESAILGPLRAIAEPIVNKNMFTDRSIIPTWEEGKDLSLRKTDNASRLGQALQPVIKVDARIIDHVVRSMLGSSGDIALKASDVGRPGKDTFKDWAGVLSGFTSKMPTWSAQDVEAVFDEAKLRGEDRSKSIQGLRDMLKRASAAETDAEREALGRRARRAAEKLRADYERHPFKPKVAR